MDCTIYPHTPKHSGVGSIDNDIHRHLCNVLLYNVNQGSLSGNDVEDSADTSTLVVSDVEGLPPQSLKPMWWHPMCGANEMNPIGPWSPIGFEYQPPTSINHEMVEVLGIVIHIKHFDKA